MSKQLLNPTLSKTKARGINPKIISPNAIRVLDKLNQAGFESYLVGGGVRDLLLGKAPKDFDIATDATPEEIKGLFRNARIIGRRFKIVHVRFGREILEVTTFRGTADNHAQQVTSKDGQLLRDNVYGNLKSDALRRDFTVNALYYEHNSHSIYDYTEGLEDLEKRQLRMIGDAETRYKEDPVRLLRVIRFCAKLGFSIEAQTETPIAHCAPLLANVPAARLFDELLKLLLAGDATSTYQLLLKYHLFEELFPQTHAVFDNDPSYRPMMDEVMANTDTRLRNDKRVTPAFILAALLWPPMIELKKSFEAHGMHASDAFNEAASTVLRNQIARITIPKRFSIPLRQIWELQWRLPKRHGKRAEQCAEHPKFRAGYDFVILREAAGEDLGQLGQWWTQYQEEDEQGRLNMVNALSTPHKNKGRRKAD